MNFTPFGGFTVEPTPAPPAACVGEKEVRGAFSRAGFLYTLLLLLHLGVAYGVFFLLRLIAPAFAATPNAVFFYDSLPFYLIVVPVIFLAMKKLPQCVPAKRQFGAGRYAISICIGCLFMVAGSMVGNAVTSLIEALTGNPTKDVTDVIGDANIFLALLFVGVLAPVAEELIFRKALIDGLSRYGEGAAVFASGLVFGLAHGNFSQCFYAFGLGLAFGYIYVKSGKIHLTILPHAALNCISVLMSKLVLPRVLPLIEKLPEATTPEETERLITGELPALAVAGLYSSLLYGAAFLGLIFFIVYYRRIRLAPANLFVTSEGGMPPVPLRTRLSALAFGNPGVAVFFVAVIFTFVLSVL